MKGDMLSPVVIPSAAREEENVIPSAAREEENVIPSAARDLHRPEGESSLSGG